MSKFLKVFVPRCLLFLIIIYLIYDTVFGERGGRDWLKAREERIRVAAQYDNVMREKIKTESEMLAYKSDPLYFEEEVRKSLKKGKKGEIFYLFQSETQK